jgi:RNA polymerase sigma factor (sigma-70 family)
MTANDLDLLRRYAAERSEEAFAALVNRHLNLVYSAALRQVRSPQLAEEVAQSVFSDLARNAGRLKSDTILTAWLYQVARRTAIDLVRKESRRQLRERVALEMSAMNSTASDWTRVEPLLDEAMATLEATDRAAILLRYFENQSLREVGQTLGTTDDAAQKRVSRAVERLREFFAKRDVSIGAGGLAAVISANAVQAAPVGLAATISTAALAGAAITAAVTATKAIAMTTMHKTLIAAALAAAVGTGVYEARHTSRLSDQVQTLRQQQAPLAEQVQQLSRERDEATNRLALQADEIAQLKNNTRELLRLRGEVGLLRQRNAELAAKAGRQDQTEKTTELARPQLFGVHTLSDAQGEGSQKMTRVVTGVDAATHEQTQREESVLVQNMPLLDQTAIRSAWLSTNAQAGQLEIEIRLTPEAAAQFAKITRDNINKQLAFVLAGTLCSTPVIRSEIPSGHIPVLVPFPEDEAREIVRRINEAAGNTPK